MSAWIPSVAHIDLMVTHMLKETDRGGGGLAVYPPDKVDAERGAYWDMVPDSDLSRYGSFAVTYLTADLTGRILLRAVVNSVSYRYPRDQITDLPGVIAELPALPDLIDGDYRWRQTGWGMEPIAVIKAVHCYQYQACERPDWRGSLAYDLCEGLIQHLIVKVPGYDAGPWGYMRPEGERSPSPYGLTAGGVWND